MGLYPDADAAGLRRAGSAPPLAAASERPSLPWTFRVVDDASVNAFALPGGFIYVTRGLMTHLNSEAELVSVLGHEIGHVTARHSVSQITKSQLGDVGLVAGMIVSPAARAVRRPRPGRDGPPLHEVRPRRRAPGRRPRPPLHDAARATTRARWSRSSACSTASARPAGEGRLPSWLSTHPAPRGSRPAHPGRHPGAAPDRHARGGARLPAPPRRHGVRREPARGVLRGRRLLPPRPALPAHVPARLADAEPEAGRRRHEPAGGRHRGADARARHQRRAGRGRVPEAAGHPARRRSTHAHRRPERGHRRLRGDRGRDARSPAAWPSWSMATRCTGCSATRPANAGGSYDRVFAESIGSFAPLDRPPVPRRAAEAREGRGRVAAHDRRRPGPEARGHGARAPCSRSSTTWRPGEHCPPAGRPRSWSGGRLPNEAR